MLHHAHILLAARCTCQNGLDILAVDADVARSALGVVSVRILLEDQPLVLKHLRAVVQALRERKQQVVAGNALRIAQGRNPHSIPACARG